MWRSLANHFVDRKEPAALEDWPAQCLNDRYHDAESAITAEQENRQAVSRELGQLSGSFQNAIHGSVAPARASAVETPAIICTCGTKGDWKTRGGDYGEQHNDSAEPQRGCRLPSPRPSAPQDPSDILNSVDLENLHKYRMQHNIAAMPPQPPPPAPAPYVIHSHEAPLLSQNVERSISGPSGPSRVCVASADDEGKEQPTVQRFSIPYGALDAEFATLATNRQQVWCHTTQDTNSLCLHKNLKRHSHSESGGQQQQRRLVRHWAEKQLRHAPCSGLDLHKQQASGIPAGRAGHSGRSWASNSTTCMSSTDDNLARQWRVTA
jgi:hypothetical protein